MVFTRSGATASLLASFRPDREVIALTPNPHVYYRMGGYWGVSSFLTDAAASTDAMIEQVEETLRSHRYAQSGDELVIVMGVPVGVRSETNTIKLHRIE